MSVNEKMTAIADAIREKTGKTEALGLDAMAVSVGEVFDAGKQEILQEQFRASVFGSGERKLSVAIPFAPDVVLIQSRDPKLSAMDSVFVYLIADFRSCSKYYGTLGYTKTAPTNSASVLQSSNMHVCIAYENGTLHIDYNNSTFANFKWPADVRYEIVAARYPGRGAKALVEEQLALLPDAATGTGTLEFSRSRINEVFLKKEGGEEEWAMLIGTKPNWTITLV